MLCDTDITMRSCSPTQGHTPFNSHQWRWVDIRVCYVQAVSQLSSFNLKLQFRWRQYTLTQYPLHTHTMHAIYPMTKDCRIVGTIVIFTTAHSHRRSHTHSPRMLKSHTQRCGGWLNYSSNTLPFTTHNFSSAASFKFAPLVYVFICGAFIYYIFQRSLQSLI